MNNDAIESPKRTALLISIAKEIGFPTDELADLTIDALEHDRIHPYDAMPDRAEPRMTMIAIMHALIGSDDDHDDARHDLDHALNSTEPCSDHPSEPCDICCAICNAD